MNASLGQYVMADPTDTTMLELAYQPIVSLQDESHSPIAFESLLRVRMNGALTGPVDFLTRAEADGSVVAVDQWVLAQVIKLAQDRPNLSTWINASQISIAHPHFLHRAVSSLIESRTLGRVTFEITETADIHHNILSKRLRAIKTGAFTCVIDDLRDGFAKRQLLGERYIAGCKLSRETTVEMGSSARVREEVQELATICRSLGKRLVLEGIENQDELELAHALNIQFAQGYFFGRPAAPEDLVQHLQMRQATAEAS